MSNIGAAGPGRHLADFERRLKGKDRFTEKIVEAIDERGRSVEAALAMMTDAIRYTFVYREDRYTEGVYADCRRIEAEGFELVDRKNSWDSLDCKGIGSRWRVPVSGQIFEVQFHTEASLAAREETYAAYQRLCALPDDDGEIRRLRAYQRAVTAAIPVPPGALDIPDYR